MKKENNKNEKEPKLKPVVFINGSLRRHANNDLQQRLLLNAMKITTDPQKLKQAIGVRTVAEVYRTLDKITMRKDYHRALAAQGLTFDAIAGVIGQEMYSAQKSGDRLKAANILLKSLGMDKYDTAEVSGGGHWEDLLLDAAEKKGVIDEGHKVPELQGPVDYDDYEVDVPEMPADVKIIKDDELEVGKGLYE